MCTNSARPWSSDPTNEALHKELAYLLLKMSENGQASREDAEGEFAELAALSAEDSLSRLQLGFLYLADHREDMAMPLLNRVLSHSDEAMANRVRMALHLPLVLEEHKSAAQPSDAGARDPRVLGERSYQSGFLKDALRYFTQAREANPLDASLALKLGWTNNLLHDDMTALHWFSLASLSADPAVAAEAKRAYRNLRPEQKRFRTTLWLYPLLSSRWGDLFGYGQVKTDLRVKRLPLHPYASVRLAGDVRRTASGPAPESLSENAFIAALGVATDTWRGATVWFEAGVATGYLSGLHWRTTTAVVFRIPTRAEPRLEVSALDGSLKRRLTACISVTSVRISSTTLRAALVTHGRLRARARRSSGIRTSRSMSGASTGPISRRLVRDSGFIRAACRHPSGST